MSERKWRGRSTDETQHKHWLGVGSAGPESLLEDLDPTLYSIDALLCGVVTGLLSKGRIGAGRPAAALLQPHNVVLWQMGFINERFDLWVGVSDEDEYLTQVTSALGVELFTWPIPRELYRELSLVVMLGLAWAAPTDFREFVVEVRRNLAEDGRVLVVLPVQSEAVLGDRDDTAWRASRVVWGDGSATKIDAMLSGDIFGLEAATWCGGVSLGSVGRLHEFGVSEYLKRHRSFFGKGAREITLARMRETDFSGPLRSKDADRNGAVLLSWGSC